ncbi:hypothetical protein K458DRAFT_85781 [Lentithecium fluviatile CBS 122367]|uniref:Uncharacterized protein n=1 Tax=Lentithecium fluviatile CBS 122367 TaxID=1168545 RepID=A0A6G1ISV2_9PLEO|nr:hypothetical protein K458DRAFT_85781 [Lentithecium fluviatile CBS 122367]
MATPTYEAILYKRMVYSTQDHSTHTVNNRHRVLHSSPYKIDGRINLHHAQPSPTLHTSLVTMSSSNNQQGQGQGGRGSNPPTSTTSQSEAQTHTAEQYPDHAAYNSSGSLQHAGAGMMQQQLGQYYLYMANTQSTGSQSSQAGRGSPAGSQGGQSNGSSRGG